MENGSYPTGAQYDIDAPYNQENTEVEIEVTVSITLSKTMVVTIDRESEETLSEVVEEQVVLPNNLALFTERMFNHDLNLKAAGIPLYLKNAIEDCKDWSVDDFEVIKDD